MRGEVRTGPGRPETRGGRAAPGISGADGSAVLAAGPPLTACALGHRSEVWSMGGYDFQAQCDWRAQARRPNNKPSSFLDGRSTHGSSPSDFPFPLPLFSFVLLPLTPLKFAVGLPP